MPSTAPRPHRMARRNAYRGDAHELAKRWAGLVLDSITPVGANSGPIHASCLTESGKVGRQRRTGVDLASGPEGQGRRQVTTGSAVRRRCDGMSRSRAEADAASPASSRRICSVRRGSSCIRLPARKVARVARRLRQLVPLLRRRELGVRRRRPRAAGSVRHGAHPHGPGCDRLDRS